jgi:hypothetical protein
MGRRIKRQWVLEPAAKDPAGDQSGHQQYTAYAGDHRNHCKPRFDDMNDGSIYHGSPVAVVEFAVCGYDNRVKDL